MKSITFYANGSARNHGCEALTTTFHNLLDSMNIEHCFASLDIREDAAYGLDKTVRFIPLQNHIEKKSIKYLNYALMQKISYSDERYYGFIFRDFFKTINPNTLYLSIGGDNYSYGHNVWLECLNSNINKRGGRTGLVGCSILDSISDDTLKKDLSAYQFIIARESITYNALKNSGINSDIYCIPDPAFTLEKGDIRLERRPGCDGYIGLNISPMVIERETIDGITMRNTYILIDWIIKNTNHDILLIPHVVATGNDDMPVLREIYKKYQGSNRVRLIDDTNAITLKGYISNCRFMITARTHASVASYSLGIPTLVIGYSVKSRGIAKDILGDGENYVLPISSFVEQDSLLRSFRKLMDNEQQVREALGKSMPGYIESVHELPKIISRYI